MKKIYFCFTFLLLTFFNFALAQNGPHIVELAASKANYSVGEKAVLLAHVRILPNNPNYEVYLDAKFNNENILLTKLTDKESASVTAPFSTVGNFTWEVKVYTQDKRRAQELSGGIAYHEATIRQAQIDLISVTNPEQRAILLSVIQESTDILSELRTDLFNLRTLVEIATLQIQVTNKENKLDPPTFFIEPDHEDASYDLGTHATFFVHVLTGFQGQETLVRASFKGTAISVTKSSEKEYVSVTGNFSTPDNGEQSYSATLLIRDKNEADALRAAISNGTGERNKFIQLKDQTSDPVLQSYYQSRINELSAIITTLYQTLESALTSVGTKNATIHVGTCGSGSGSGGSGSGGGGSGSGSGGGACNFKNDYPPGFVCELTGAPVVVSNQTELDEYLHTYGTESGNFRSVKINFSTLAGNVVIHSPCEIILETGIGFNVSSICMDGREGVRGSANILDSTQMAFLSENGVIEIGSDTHLRAESILINSHKPIRVLQNSVLSAVQDISITSQSTVAGLNGQIAIAPNVRMDASTITMLTDGPGSIGLDTVISTNSAHGLVFDANPCAIAPTVQIIGTASGSCFP